MNNYEDIINYNYIMQHARMPINKRASIFSPFSALTGYEDILKEVRRETKSQIKLSDDEKELLNYQLPLLIKDKKEIIVVYFIKDKYKIGGEYFTQKGIITKIDNEKRLIFLENNRIPLDDIIEIKEA